MRERIENVCFNISSTINKEVLFAYLTGALVGIMNRLNRVCEKKLHFIDILLKFQHKNAKNGLEFVENLCSQTNFVFFSNFDLKQECVIPTPKSNDSNKIIKSLKEHFFSMKKQLENLNS